MIPVVVNRSIEADNVCSRVFSWLFDIMSFQILAHRFLLVQFMLTS